MRGDLLFRWAGQAYVVGLGLAILLLLAEGWWPRARQRTELGRRWLANLSAFGITLIVFRWLPQLSLLGAAMLAERNGWGLLNQLHVPDFVAVTLGWLAVDLSGYLVHRAEHRFPLLWRVHRLHHSDPDVDVTTTYRFHPFEVLLRAGVQVIVAIAMGMPPAAAVGYLLLTAAISVFSHANLRLPHALDRAVGMVVITPGIHRTHHSIDPTESNSNFSVCLSCWDRLFGTFRSAPLLGHDKIIFGVEGRTPHDATSIPRMLADPFLFERPALQPAAMPPGASRNQG
jgi:sterol desaturase/sphingolipid hydroxylase (fatty acid hydroxylase superfamily)